MTPGEMKEALRGYLEDVVNPALGDVLPTPLLPIKYFVKKITTNEDDRICSIFNPGGDWVVDDETDLFVARFQLPGEDDPDKYNDVIWKLIKDMPPRTIDALYITVAYANGYPSSNGQTGYCEYVIKRFQKLQKC